MIKETKEDGTYYDYTDYCAPSCIYINTKCPKCLQASARFAKEREEYLENKKKDKKDENQAKIGDNFDKKQKALIVQKDEIAAQEYDDKEEKNIIQLPV